MSDSTDNTTPNNVVTDTTIPTMPPAKEIEITLVWYVKAYQVKSITNTIWYKPGQWLSPDVVQMLCGFPEWKVTMIDNDILQTIMGVLVGGASKLVP